MGDALVRCQDFNRDFEDGRFRTVVPGFNDEMLFVIGGTNTSLNLTRIISVCDAELYEIESMASIASFIFRLMSEAPGSIFVHSAPPFLSRHLSAIRQLVADTTDLS